MKGSFGKPGGRAVMTYLHRRQRGRSVWNVLGAGGLIFVFIGRSALMYHLAAHNVRRAHN